MAERELGDRILFAAADWEAVRSEEGVMGGRTQWDALCQLATRADAAEALALAVVAVEDARRAWFEADGLRIRPGDGGEEACAVAMAAWKAAEPARKDALARWREVRGG